MAGRNRKGSAAQLAAADPWLDPRLLSRMFSITRTTVTVVDGDAPLVLSVNPDRYYVSFQSDPSTNSAELWALFDGSAAQGRGFFCAAGRMVEIWADDYPVIVGRAWSVLAVGGTDVIITELSRLPGLPSPRLPNLTYVSPSWDADAGGK